MQIIKYRINYAYPWYDSIFDYPILFPDTYSLDFDLGHNTSIIGDGFLNPLAWAALGPLAKVQKRKIKIKIPNYYDDWELLEGKWCIYKPENNNPITRYISLLLQRHFQNRDNSTVVPSNFFSRKYLLTKKQKAYIKDNISVEDLKYQRQYEIMKEAEVVLKQLWGKVPGYSSDWGRILLAFEFLMDNTWVFSPPRTKRLMICCGLVKIRRYKNRQDLFTLPLKAAEISVEIQNHELIINFKESFKDALKSSLEIIFGKKVNYKSSDVFAYNEVLKEFESDVFCDKFWNSTYDLTDPLEDPKLLSQCNEFDGEPIYFKVVRGYFIYWAGSHWRYLIDRRKEKPYIHRKIEELACSNEFDDVREEIDKRSWDAMMRALPGSGWIPKR